MGIIVGQMAVKQLTATPGASTSVVATELAGTPPLKHPAVNHREGAQYSTASARSPAVAGAPDRQTRE
jgi:hypothetical protein